MTRDARFSASRELPGRAGRKAGLWLLARRPGLQPAGWYAAPVTIWTSHPHTSCRSVTGSWGHFHPDRKHGDLPFSRCFLPLHGDVDLRKQTSQEQHSMDDFRRQQHVLLPHSELATRPPPCSGVTTHPNTNTCKDPVSKQHHVLRSQGDVA